MTHNDSENIIHTGIEALTAVRAQRQNCLGDTSGEYYKNVFCTENAHEHSASNRSSTQDLSNWGKKGFNERVDWEPDGQPDWPQRSCVEMQQKYANLTEERCYQILSWPNSTARVQR